MSASQPDTDILRELWRSTIPLELQLASNEIAGSEPRRYYMNIPRLTYLTVVTADIKEYFSNFTAGLHDEIWFDYNDMPLKWQYPIGVLYDTFANNELPFKLTVHFQAYPAELLRCPDESFSESRFHYAYKESYFMKYGNLDNINEMKRNQHTDLWNGIKRSDYGLYWNVNHNVHRSTENIKSIPIRIARPQSIFILQEPFSAFTFDRDYEYTLGDLLKLVVPDTIEENEDGELECNQRIVIQGIVPTLDMSLLWIMGHLSYPDNFLYISLVPPLFIQ
eukprot:TRINITY_DN8430_c0_g1_i1.p1 TRINITY_DN8430_c0_g1~~TRINITY_DN8430_c0_g1_i1.p1  ORF type:complete len:288 (-),score=31.42 TRINITY_DN8430_c0_g1_i1:42-875(-)